MKTRFRSLGVRSSLCSGLMLGTSLLLVLGSGCRDKETEEEAPGTVQGGNPGSGGTTDGVGGATSSGGLNGEGGVTLEGQGGVILEGQGGATIEGMGGAPGVGGAATCAADADCTVPGAGRCDAGRGQCVQCLDSFHCDASQACRGNTCVVDTTCSTTSTCPNGLLCNPLGLCTDCVTGADCPSGESCIGYECRLPCTILSDCRPSGLVCDQGLGFCVECQLNEDCPTGRVCTSGGVCAVDSGLGMGGAGQGGASDPGVGGSTDGSGGATGDMGGTSGEAGAGLGGAEAMGGETGAGGVPSPVGCGNGVLDPGESCDDGNTLDGDCCSAACTVPEGCGCTEPVATAESLSLPVTYRDFSSEHPDFEPGASGLETATTDLVETILDAEGKPVLAVTDGSGLITDTASFAQWYRDIPGTNGTTSSSMLFWNSNGSYVNRADSGGRQFVGWQNVTYCANADCSECSLEGGLECLSPCIAWGTASTDTCTALRVYFDGDPYFFPIDGSDTNVTPETELTTATLPPAYGGDWSAEPGGGLHNFHFTSELGFRFRYESTRSYTIDFLGDDDAWVFVNGTLAVDLGGIHTPVQGSIVIDASSASALGLSDGVIAEVRVFQAERQTTGSTYRLTLTGFGFGPSVCSAL